VGRRVSGDAGAGKENILVSKEGKIHSACAWKKNENRSGVRARRFDKKRIIVNIGAEKSGKAKEPVLFS